LDSDTPVPQQASNGSDLVLLRHDSLRRTAPAVQHEVNNAMMVLASNLEMLGRAVPEGAPRRQLDRAQEAVRRLDATMRGFLDAARRDAEEPDLACPIAALDQALPLLRVVLGARHGIDREAPGMPLPAVRLDRARLDLALLRLVQHAAQVMPAGSRIAAGGERRAGTDEVALLLRLPAVAEPAGEVAALLAEAAGTTGGRLERVGGGIALVWPRAR
jgi:signal transduction histidine kinase